jgi:hypothetical protein
MERKNEDKAKQAEITVPAAKESAVEAPGA